MVVRNTNNVLESPALLANNMGGTFTKGKTSERKNSVF